MTYLPVACVKIRILGHFQQFANAVGSNPSVGRAEMRQVLGLEGCRQPLRLVGVLRPAQSAQTCLSRLRHCGKAFHAVHH